MRKLLTLIQQNRYTCVISLDVSRELKKLCNMRVMVIQIVVRELGRVFKGLEKGMEQLEIRGRIIIIQTRTLLRSARILKRVLET